MRQREGVRDSATDHHVKDAEMIDHIVRLVEIKAAEIEAAQTTEQTLDAAE